MGALEAAFTKACEERVIPGAVLIACNKSGTFHYEKAFGALSIRDGDQAAKQPLRPDAVFVLASCTKLLTAIAALQCVERGLIGLDEDVARAVPELAALPVLKRFDEDENAVTVPRRTPITLRAGLGYDGLSPKLSRWRASRGEALGKGSTLVERFGSPLLYEPGTSWGYGCAMDWAGRVVERVSGKTLEAYFAEYLWKPLGVTDMTFWLEQRPDLKARLAGMTVRDDDKVVPFDGPEFNGGIKECLGGQGCYGAVTEYIKVLRSLLVDDEVLLSRTMTKQLFSPQLSAGGRSFLNGLRNRPEIWSFFPGEYPRHVQLDWGLGGMLTLDDDEGWRGAGTMVWSGMPNLFWFIDRKSGLCGIYGGQVLPPGDSQTNQMITTFEKAMYRMASAETAKI